MKDSKSFDGNIVWVQVPPSAPIVQRRLDITRNNTRHTLTKWVGKELQRRWCKLPIMLFLRILALDVTLRSVGWNDICLWDDIENQIRLSLEGRSPFMVHIRIHVLIWSMVRIHNLTRCIGAPAWTINWYVVKREMLSRETHLWNSELVTLDSS